MILFYFSSLFVLNYLLFRFILLNIFMTSTITIGIKHQIGKMFFNIIGSQYKLINPTACWSLFNLKLQDIKFLKSSPIQFLGPIYFNPYMIIICPFMHILIVQFYYKLVFETVVEFIHHVVYFVCFVNRL